MTTLPMYNPGVPYVGLIDGGFHPGKMVRIQGTVPISASRFAVNLQCGASVYPRADIALHVSPRFDPAHIARSSLHGMNWGPDETVGPMPLARGQGFEIIILCDPSLYKIAVNGQHFTEFVHRIPYQQVTHLAVEGDVTLTLIQYEGGSHPPPVPPGGGIGFTAPPLPSTAMGVGTMPYPTNPSLVPATPYPTGPGGRSPSPVPYAYGASGYQQGPPQPHGYYQGPPQPPGYEQGPYTAYVQPGPGQYPPPPAGYNQYPAPPQKKGLGGLLDKAGAAVAGVMGSKMGGHHGGQYGGHHGGGHGIGPMGTMGTAVGAGLAGAALTGHLSPKKAYKAQKKSHSKALKYGLPLAGVGLGAYALTRGFHGHSSSSSSSSSEEE